MYTFTLFGKVLRQFDVKAYFLRELNEFVTCMTARRDWFIVPFFFPPLCFLPSTLRVGKTENLVLYLDLIHLQNSIAMRCCSGNT